MKNIITHLSGATLALKAKGTTINLTVEGEAGQVHHALVLMYNYRMIDDIPDYIDDKSTYFFTRLNRRAFLRGLLAANYANLTAWHKTLTRKRCARAVTYTVRMYADMMPASPVLDFSIAD